MIRLHNRVTEQEIYGFPQIELKRIWESASIGIDRILIPWRCYGGTVQFINMKFLNANVKILHATLVDDYDSTHSVRLTHDPI